MIRMWNYCYILRSFGLILLFLMCCHANESHGGATMVIEWIYDNQNSELENGAACDRLGDPMCDVYFTLCLRNAASTGARRDSQDCLLHQSTTRYFDNMKRLEFKGADAVKVYIPQPVPNSYGFEIDAFDIDLLGRSQRIGAFIAENFKVLPDGEVVQVPVHRKSHKYSNPTMSLSVYVSMQCDSNFYGRHCTIECLPEIGRYSCDFNGTRICVSGFTGPLCDQIDFCQIEKCAENAVCINKKDGSGRICECSGREAPECYPGYDPCQSGPCEHDGTCWTSGDFNQNFYCNCTGPWTGYRCTERKLACIEESKRILRETTNLSEKQIGHMELPDPCFNGGKCLEYTDKFTFRCICPAGWAGERCEIQYAKAENNTMMILLLLIGAFLLVLIVLIVAVFIWRYRRSKRILDFAGKGGGIVYFHPDHESDSTASPGRFMNDVYGVKYNDQPILVESAARNSFWKNDKRNDVYDECDPLEFNSQAGVYGNTFGNGAFRPNASDTVTSAASGSATNDVPAPPLPERPRDLSAFPSTRSSVGSVPQVIDSTQYKRISDLSYAARTPSDHVHPTIYRPMSPGSYRSPSTFGSVRSSNYPFPV
ncbi:unnamed protein product [Calicophoron daubneyi]|uniref:Delta-like protein n=1 Tax=Calicophoron daubneyi TaxID=300641 RepID=A0AAV2TSQ5_CALDB